MAADASSEHSLTEHIRAERVRFVFIQSALPIVFSPVAAAILSLTLWHVVSHRVLLWWTGALVALCAGLPLALSIVAARAAVLPVGADTALHAVHKELCEAGWIDTGDPSSDVRAVLRSRLSSRVLGSSPLRLRSAP